MNKKLHNILAFPSSFVQKRIWFLEKLEKGRLRNNIGGVNRFSGVVRSEDIKKIIQIILDRHEICRTNFQETLNGDLVQIVHEKREAKFLIFDLCELSTEEKKVREKEIIESEINYTFNLLADQLIRFVFIRLSQDSQVLLVVGHHIVFDAWSMSIAASEFFYLAQALFYKQPILLPPLAIQYKEYAAWEQSDEFGKKIEKSKIYWLEKLSDDLPVLELPFDFPRTLSQSYICEQIEFVVDQELKNKLDEIAQRFQVTPFVFLLAVYKTMIYRLSGQRDLLVGTFVANRDLPELDNVIGPFLNNVVLRSEIDDDQSFSSFLKKLKDTVLSAMENKDYPFENLIEELSLERDMSRSPIFSTTFQIFNSGGHKDLKSNIFYNHTEEYKTFDKTLGQFDISVHIHNRELDYLVVFIYDQALFKHETIERFQGYFKKLIISISADPDELIGRLEMISSEEKYFLSEQFNQTEKKYGQEQSLYRIFAKSAETFSRRISVSDASESWTYSVLKDKVDNLAIYFSNNGVAAGDVVGLALERSNIFLASLLAITKLGAVFLPLDWTDPIERKEFILRDADVKYIILEDEYQQIGEAKIFWRSGLESLKHAKTNDLPDEEENLRAAIIYTSGSTGRPKGVVLTQRGIINHAWGKNYFLGATSKDVFVQNLSASFVASLWQFFSPLFIGARLVIYANEVARSPRRLIDKIATDKISIWETSPSVLKIFLEVRPFAKYYSPDLKILLTGEDTPDYLANMFFSYYDFDLFNAYGQTECCDDTLMYKIPKSRATRVLLGNPIINTQAYILNDKLQLAPINTVGEIYISGNCLSEGYLNQPVATDATFLDHPLNLDKKIFKTGDLGRRLFDGNLEYLGRYDRQVKIRGKRLDPKEIESLVLGFEKINDCLVVFKNGKLGLYYHSSGKISTQELRNHLQKSLPVYALPHFYKRLLSFPFSPHGKIDLLALPDFCEDDLVYGQFLTPVTKEEKLLEGVWKKILGVKKIGLNDDFFALGGHSLKAVRLLSKIREKNYEISLTDIFRFSKLSEMARQIEKVKNEKSNPNNLLTVIGDYLRADGRLGIASKKLELKIENIVPQYFQMATKRLRVKYPDININIENKCDINFVLKRQKENHYLMVVERGQKINSSLFAKILIDWQKFYNLSTLSIDDDKVFSPFSSYPDYYHCLHINILEMIYFETGRMISENLPPAFDYFMLPSYLVGEAGLRRDNDFNGHFLEENEIFVGAKKIGLRTELVDLKDEKAAWDFFIKNSKHKPLLLMGNNFYLPSSLYYHNQEFIASLSEQRNLLPINFSIFQMVDNRIITSSVNLNFFGEITKTDFLAYWKNLKSFPGFKKDGDGLAFRVLELKNVGQLLLSDIDNYYEALRNTVQEYFRGRVIVGNKKLGFIKLCLGKAIWQEFKDNINDNMTDAKGAVSDIVIIDVLKRLQKSRLFLHKFLHELSGLNDDFAPDTSLTAIIIGLGDAEFERLYNKVKENKIEYEPVLTFLPRLEARKQKFLSLEDKKILLSQIAVIELKELELFTSMKTKLDKIK